MSPCWDKELQKQSQIIGKVLIPGVFSPSEINQALNFGCRIIKLFPASTLGLNYLQQIKPSLSTFPFIIAAGWLKVIDIDKWFEAGFHTIALGRDLIKGSEIDPFLKKWLSDNK